MTLEEYHTIVIERLLTLYRDIPLEYCGYVIQTIEDIEAVYYDTECKKVVNSGSNRPAVKPSKSVRDNEWPI